LSAFDARDLSSLGDQVTSVLCVSSVKDVCEPISGACLWWRAWEVSGSSGAFRQGLTVKPGPASVRSAYCKLAAATTREAPMAAGDVTHHCIPEIVVNSNGPRNVESRL